MALTVTPTSRLVVLGQGGRLVIRRLSESGAADSTFGTSGQVTMTPAGYEKATSVAVDSLGRVIVAYLMQAQNTSGFQEQCVLARLDSSGQLDSSFGKNGVTAPITLPYPAGQSPDCGKLVVLSDNRILDVSSDAGSIARFDTNGTQDSTFGSGAQAIIQKWNVVDLSQVLPDSQGNLLVGGTAFNASDGYRLLVGRLTPNGDLDTTFGNGGAVVVGFGDLMTGWSASDPNDDHFARVILRPDATILAVGIFGNRAVDIAHITAAGALDPAYGTGGRALLQDDFTNMAQPGPGLVSPGPSDTFYILLDSQLNNPINSLTLGRVLPGLAIAQNAFHPLTPSRILDTRNDTGATGPVAANGTMSLQVTGQGGVPSTGVGAVAINVTVTQPTAPGFATVYPDGMSPPTASNLNFVAGQTIPNLVIVPVASDGKVDLFNGSSGTSQYVGDVVGWFSAP